MTTIPATIFSLVPAVFCFASRCGVVIRQACRGFGIEFQLRFVFWRIGNAFQSSDLQHESLNGGRYIDPRFDVNPTDGQVESDPGDCSTVRSNIPSFTA